MAENETNENEYIAVSSNSSISNVGNVQHTDLYEKGENGEQGEKVGSRDVTTTRSSDGQVTTTTVDRNPDGTRQQSVVDNGNTRTTTYYDENDNPSRSVEVTREGNTTTTTTRDANNNPTEVITESTTHVAGYERTERQVSDGNGNVLSTRVTEGHSGGVLTTIEKTNTYDANNNLTGSVEVRTQGNTTTTTNRDANNNVTGSVEVKTQGNTTTTTNRDANNNVTGSIEVTREGNTTTTTTRDANNNPTEIKTETSSTVAGVDRKTTTVTDGEGKPISTTTVEGKTNNKGEYVQTTTTESVNSEDGTVVKSSSTTTNGKVTESSSTQTDSNGNVQSKTDTEYTYNGDNLESKTDTTTDYTKNADNPDTIKTTTKYDDKGIYDGQHIVQHGPDGKSTSDIDRTGTRYEIVNEPAVGDKTTTKGISNAYYTEETVEGPNGTTTVVKDANGNLLYTVNPDGSVTAAEGAEIPEELQGKFNDDGTIDLDKFEINEDNLMAAIADMDRFMQNCFENASKVGAVDTTDYAGAAKSAHNPDGASANFNNAADNLADAAICLSGFCGTNGAQSDFAPLLGRLCNTVAMLREDNAEARQSMEDILKEARGAGNGSGDADNFAEDVDHGTGTGGPDTGVSDRSGGANDEEDRVGPEAGAEDTDVVKSQVGQQQVGPTNDSSGHDNGQAQNAYKKGGGGGGGRSTIDSNAATNEDAATAMDDMLNNEGPVVEVVETGNEIHEPGELSSLGADIGSLNIEALTSNISAKNVGVAAGVGLAAAGAAAAIAAYKDKEDDEDEDEESSDTDYSMDPNLNYDDLMM